MMGRGQPVAITRSYDDLASEKTIFMRTFHLSSAVLRDTRLFLLCAFLGLSQTMAAKPVGLKTEHLVRPLGIDEAHPRFSWMDDNTGYAVKQLSWRIVVGTDSTAVAHGRGGMWDSGTVSSDAQLTTYQGRPLQPFTRYYWRVYTSTNKGKAKKSSVESFEMGLMTPDNLKGEWITDRHDTAYQPAPYFRKAFTLKGKVSRARVYITSAGPYELSLNGKHVGDRLLDPAFTTYDKRLLYATLDVTPLLQQGDNMVGVVVGNSWYNHQPLAVWNYEKAPWRARPGFCMNLRVTYKDGRTETLVTDDSWQTAGGPLVYNNIYTGEHYDFTLEDKAWDTTSGSSTGWEPAVTRPFPTRNIVAQAMPPIRKTQAYRPVRVTRFTPSNYLYDFGQNMAGVTQVRLRGPRGTRVVIRYGERLKDNGHLDQTNIDYFYKGDSIADPFQGNVLILSGGDDVFDMRFSYMGFRFAEVWTSTPVMLNADNITAWFVHTDVPAVGGILTGDTLLSSINHATDYAYLSNLVGYPTDCPQREKNGWTGDAHLACQTGLYAFDGITLYEKWMADHRDTQRGGILPDIIPTCGWGWRDHNLVDWTSTVTIIPWNLYLFYGDTKCLADEYDYMKRYVDFTDAGNPTHTTSWGRGDWVPVKTRSNVELTSSVYFYVNAHLLSKIAAVLGHQDDAAHYAQLARDIRDAINAKFLNRETGIYADGTMTELSMPLYWGVVPDDMRDKVTAALVQNVKEHDVHIDCGVHGTKAILNALSENGHADLAYRMATQDTYPSWGYWIKNGQTTLTENWKMEKGKDDSYNHIMYGEIGAWFYKGLGGIFPDERQPGFKNVIIKPNFMRGEGHFAARHTSPYGEIVSEWTWTDDKTVECHVVVPPNSTADFIVDRPDVAEVTLKAGKRTSLSDQSHVSNYNSHVVSGSYTFTVKLR